MKFGINVESLQKILERELKETNEVKKLKEIEKYISKIVEYTFFIQNEIEVSEKLNNVDTRYQFNSAYHFLTIKKYHFIKICESNKQILEKMNINIDLTTTNNKKFVLLKFKKDTKNGVDNNKMNPFIDCFFYHNHINNTSIFPEKPRTFFIFWDFINYYETLFDDLIYLSNKDILFLDFSAKNLLYNNYSVFLNKFDKCLIRQHFNITEIDFQEDDDLRQSSKYIEIEKYIDKFIKIIESIEYYGNKHFDLYFSKQLIKCKNFHSVYQDLDTIIDDYLKNIYFLKNFSDKFKDVNKTKWKSQIKSKMEENIKYFNIDTKKLNWKLYLILMLEKYDKTVWETFSMNSLFLNITYYMIKIFDIKEKSSIVHSFFKYLFTNMDIDCTSFNSNCNININTSRYNYNKFRGFFDNLANISTLSHVTIEQQQELYDVLLKNVEIF